MRTDRGRTPWFGARLRKRRCWSMQGQEEATVVDADVLPKHPRLTYISVFTHCICFDLRPARRLAHTLGSSG